ncbi:MAG: UPF0280 family protein [Actinomycetota bacterium]|nr:UPF0280 family protein [Actinomycetota bacterium]
MYEPRFYREKMLAKGLVSFQVLVSETDLYISANGNFYHQALEAVLKYRKDLEEFIAKHPIFKTTLKPYDVPDSAPEIVKSMAEAARKVDVGPMAAVAGAIAEFVGRDLLKFSREVIVENGGDIFIKTRKPRKIAIYAGDSPLSNKIAIEIKPDQTPLGVCTSAGTLGHSLSFGEADAVVVLSQDTCLADATATAIGNQVHRPEDIDRALTYAQTIVGLMGVVIIKGNKMGVWGDLEISPL